jgi:hypothetical protein
VDHGCIAGDITLLVTRRVWGPDRLPWPVSQLQAFRGEQELYTFSYPHSAGASIRYETATGMVYEATYYGLGILEPGSGVRRIVVADFGSDDSVLPDHVHQPCIQCGRLYVLNGEGRLFALRHP